MNNDQLKSQRKDDIIHIGILGTAKIARDAIINPSKKIPGTKIEAIASRDFGRGNKFAKKFNIPRLYSNYQDLINANDIQLIYIPLPNNMHCDWSVRSMEAGKHVLCEKPIASNASEAEMMLKASEKYNRILMEGFHNRYHPMTLRLKQILDNEELGKIQSISSDMCISLFNNDDIRFKYDLSGGAMLDAGCYLINLVRYLINSEPEVMSAKATLKGCEIDGSMRAELLFPNKILGHIFCSLVAFPWDWRFYLRVVGDKGEMLAVNPFGPHIFNLIRVKNKLGRRYEFINRDKTTYEYQLTAMVKAIKEGVPILTNLTDSIANMRVIDQIYQKAGMKKRGY